MPSPFTTPTADSTPFDNDTNGFESDNVQEAIEEVLELADAAIYTIPLVYNGTLSGTQFISYSNLTPDSPIVIPKKSSFVGFTFSNSRTGADYTINLRNNTTTGTPFYTTSKTNTQFFAETLATPEPFEAGDTISVQYADNGTNGSDGVWLLTFKVTI